MEGSKFQEEKKEKRYYLKEVCQILSISTATGRNWMKLGKIFPTGEQEGKPYFSENYVREILENLQDKSSKTLKGRRNKRHISGNSMYKSYIPADSANLPGIEKLMEKLEGCLLTDRQLRAVLAECALQLLCQAYGKNYHFTENFLFHYMQGEIELGEYKNLIQDLLTKNILKDRTAQRECLVQEKQKPELPVEEEQCKCHISDKRLQSEEQKLSEILMDFQISYVLERNVDVLGMIYISLKNLRERKAAGSYYTPTHIVKKLTGNLLPVESVKTASELKNSDFISRTEKTECKSVNSDLRTEKTECKSINSCYGKESMEYKTSGSKTENTECKSINSCYGKESMEYKTSGSKIEKTNWKILDPCCGTGNFLLQLSDEYSMEQIYGWDIDRVSVLLARINMALKFKNTPVSLIKEHIKIQDFLLAEDNRQYNCILGNPPWGYQFSEEEVILLREKFKTARGKNVESYDVFLEQALTLVKTGGSIAFVLPEAILNVKSHLEIRRLLMENVQIEQLDYLGNVFDKVQCPAVILQLVKTQTPLDTSGMKVSYEEQKFQIQTRRSVEPENFNFHMTDEEYQILTKIERQENITFLQNQADFALGIVTGNNREYIQDRKNEKNEMVLKGANIQKYKITSGDCYLTYVPKQFQQTAPEEYYRAKEKLFYRFIGESLVFAYDNQQRLSLNSCNILIPHVEHMDIKYIMAVLNSRIIQFVYRRKFRSVKVLRGYLEQLPIPVAAEEEQQSIIALTEKIMAETDPEKWMEYYEKIDRQIASAFGLTESEYAKICKAQGSVIQKSNRKK